MWAYFIIAYFLNINTPINKHDTIINNNHEILFDLSNRIDSINLICRTKEGFETTKFMLNQNIGKIRDNKKLLSFKCDSVKR